MLGNYNSFVLAICVDFPFVGVFFWVVLGCENWVLFVFEGGDKFEAIVGIGSGYGLEMYGYL